MSGPLPTSTSELDRVEHTRLRRRMLYGEHRPDVQGRLSQAIGNVRREAWGPIDMTSNPFQLVWTQLAVLYRTTPTVVPPAGAEDVAAAVGAAGYWTLMQRVQRDCLGLREMLMRVDLDDDGQPAFRPVFPDLVEPETRPEDPRQPTAITEHMEDPDHPGRIIRVVVDPRAGTYMALDGDDSDVSERVLGGNFSGDAWPEMWTGPDGERLMPYVAFHAADTGAFFDPYSHQEMVEATLQLGVYYSFYGHVLRNAAWRQRYLLGAEPAGLAPDKDGQRSEVVTDPATVLLLRQQDDYTGQPIIDAWDASADPEAILRSIRNYEQRVLEMAVGGVDVTKTESDIRSGYSLAVSREAQREAQRAYEPLFERSDLAVLTLVSKMMRRPHAGWRVQYNAIPKSPAEIRAEAENLRSLIDAGLMDRATAYQRMHPELTYDEAAAAVERIAMANRRSA